MQRLIVLYLMAGFVVLAPQMAHSQASKYLAMDAGDARFVYSDVNNFLRAYQLMKSDSNPEEVLQREYIDKASPGLEMFISKYGLTAEQLHEAINKYPERYAQIGQTLEKLYEKETYFREQYVRLSNFIPNAVFLPTYYLVEIQRGIGSGSVEGTLVSIDNWQGSAEDKSTMLVHEQVHIQQVLAVGYQKYLALYGPEKNLLGLCVREGTAEFLAHLVTGSITQSKALDYTIKNEKQLWKLFKNDKNGSETGDWMWKKPENPNQPPHVGYAMGFLIARSYYENTENKTKAVRDILATTDFETFLKQSKYQGKSSKL